MLHSIIDFINTQFSDLVTGSKVYGIAKTALKDEKLLPYLVEEGKYVGVDDTYPMMVYHKEQSLSSANVARSGYGDNLSDLSNTYGMSLIVFFDEKKTGVKADELYTLIQARITGILKLEGYKSIRVGVSNAILNDGQVWRQEYGDAPFKLFASQRLIQIGYSVVMTLDKNCFPKCISKS
jgi:hypothetical protein